MGNNIPRFCEQCGARLVPDARFCEKCGRPVRPVPARPSAQSLPQARPATTPARAVPPPPAPVRPAYAPPRAAPAPAKPRRGAPWKGIAIGCAGVLVLVAVLGTAAWLGLRPGGWLAGWQGRTPGDAPYVWDVPPNPYADYTSDPLDVEPLPGVHITAPAGALDQPREFEVRQLPAREAKPARDKLEKQGMLVLAALDVDAGMTPEERFRLPVTVAFDLEALGVDPNLWPYAQVVAVDEQGWLVPMATQAEGSELYWRTPHNGPVFIVCGLSTIAGLIEYGLIEPDRQAETEGKEWKGITSSGGHFYVLWPEDKHQPSPEAQAAFAEFERLWKEYAFARSVPAASPGVPSSYKSLEAYKADVMVQIRALEAQLNDRQWQADYYAHPAAPPVAESLEFAYAYLVKRGFNPPGHVVRVYLRSPWMHGADNKGFAENRKTRDPYISVNLDDMPIKARGDALTGKDGVGVEVTLLHELFHVFQAQYGSSEYWDRNVFWIGEAAALTLERECWPEYAERFGVGDLGEGDEYYKQVKGFYENALTVRQQYWNAYRTPMEPLSLISDNEGLQHHGYGLSFFFEYLKGKLSAGDPNAFLPAFYHAFNRAGSAAGALDEMAKSAGVSKGLAGLYLDFVASQADEIAASLPDPKREEISMQPRSRHREWKAADAPPLSSRIYRIAMPEGARGYEKALAVVQTKDLPPEIKLRWHGLTKTGWTELTTPTTVITPTVIRARTGTENGLLLQVVGAYMPTQEMDGEGGWTVAFLIPLPRAPELPQGPHIDFERAAKDEALDVRWVASGLAGREDFRYLVRAVTLEDGKVVGKEELLVERNKTRATIPFAQLLPELAEAEDVRYEIRVTVSEALLVGNRRIEGAPSEETVIAIDASRELKTYKGKNSELGITEEFTYYDVYKGMPSSWVPGYSVLAAGTWNGNAAAWRWLVELNDGAHPRKVIHGKYVMRYSSGQVCAEAEFRYGVLQGPCRFYHEDGVLAGTGQYVDGEPDGNWVANFSSGEEAWNEQYDRGQRVD